MFSPKNLNRFQACSCHLLASAVVALLSGGLVFAVWYPGLLARASGVLDIVLLLLAVDVILGPVITLIIFDTKKKELRRDLVIVVAIQVAALLYGIHTVFIARPAYMVFNSGRIDVVYANEISDENLAKAVRPEFALLPYWGPKLIAARLPDDPKIREEIIRSAVTGGDDVQHMPQYYLPFSEDKTAVLKHIKPLDNLKSSNRDNLIRVEALTNRYAASREDVGYLPLKGKVRDLVVVVNRKNAAILEIADLSPWNNSGT